MATTQANPTVRTKQVQNTVFDLTSFDDVKLVKDVVLPAPVTSVEEALAAVGNDAAALLKVINDGLEEHAVKTAKSDKTGWTVESEDTETPQTYNGQYAEGDVSKAINAGILSMAKVLAFAKGGWDALKGESGKKVKSELKEAAKASFRENPAILASFGVAPTAPPTEPAGK